ncbi:response regulator transcription factor [Paenilisteria rocourtiae]|uniref:DNA-binding response OmpR family regulator n=1 Tax=Listeria rocourtiae TaxID=647910 RepID=A0A4R6ZNT4_9LIST|nr:response regulator transcription factor [Listeria rocourtiae]MBC1434139.1 response regulator transcription factor [Listeria rocourtiae]MBC1603664.1 response regulator transcription factor [Listeria rocourtiae]TDR54022.1 DNA-binding response OmpR family regulator [Listeria rocourtiae]
MKKFKVGIVEDETAIAEKIAEKLETWQYEAITYDDYTAIASQVKENIPDLIILDIKLPAYDGFYWAQEIRKFSKIPILFLSSQNEPMSKITSVTVGGDLFIEKPFNLDVLVSNVQALLRRSYDYNGQTNLVYKNVTLDIDNWAVTCNEKMEALTKNEGLLLRTFMQAPEKIHSRDQLMEVLWENAAFISENTLTQNVSRLRKKLGDLTGELYIESVRGMGYRL